MQNLHPELLTELAHSHIDDRVRSASRASVVRTSRVPRRLGVHRRPRHRFPVTVA